MSLRDLAGIIYRELIFELEQYGEYPELSPDEYELISVYRNDPNFVPPPTPHLELSPKEYKAIARSRNEDFDKFMKKLSPSGDISSRGVATKSGIKLTQKEFEMIEDMRGNYTLHVDLRIQNPKLYDDEILLLSKYRAQTENQMREKQEQKRLLLHERETNLRKQLSKRQPSPRSSTDSDRSQMSDDFGFGNEQSDIDDLGFDKLSLNDSDIEMKSPKSYAPRKTKSPKRKRKSPKRKVR